MNSYLIDPMAHKILAFRMTMVFICAAATLGFCSVELQSADNDVSTFTLWQLPSQTPSQNMSYVLRSREGAVVVIDGGNTGDAEYLRGFLAPLGNRVTAWFVSHPHPDHVDALTVLLRQPQGLTIDCIYGSTPDEAWVAEHEPNPPTHLATVRNFNQAIHDRGQAFQELSPGQRIEIDGMLIEVLGIKNTEIVANAINNSSIVLRIADDHKSVLFTGDLGVEGGRKLLKSEYGARLSADYVQMAHHGQAGVDINFYRAVRPRYCLWPTPTWLWDNDSGGGKGSGPWQTISVRQWMDRMNVEKHYVSADGLIRID